MKMHHVAPHRRKQSGPKVTSNPHTLSLFDQSVDFFPSSSLLSPHLKCLLSYVLIWAGKGQCVWHSWCGVLPTHVCTSLLVHTKVRVNHAQLLCFWERLACNHEGRVGAGIA